MSNRFALLVEDDPQDRQLTLRALNQVYVANRTDVGRDGAALRATICCVVGFIQSTIPTTGRRWYYTIRKLPELRGFNESERVRASVLPLVVLTCSDAESNLVASYQLGA